MKQKSNLHTHTTFSDGRGTVEETVSAAMERGFVSLGISDHSYDEYGADYSLARGSEREYCRTVREARDKYSGKIDIFCGIELDSMSVTPDVDLDYVIASVHSLSLDGWAYPVDLSPEGQRKMIDTYFGGDRLGFAERYFESVVRHTEKTKPDIVGHFDLITKYSLIDEDDPAYRRLAVEAIRECAKYCRRFEVNTGAMARGLRTSPYPADFLLSELLKLSCSVVITSDAHYPEKIDFAFDETAAYLKRLGFTAVQRLTANGFVDDVL